MLQITTNQLRGLLAAQEPPCVSLYQQTHRVRTGGEVIVVPAERMPTNTGLAATFRH